MYKDNIDLVEFFDDRYRYIDNKMGIGGISIITQNQMVFRTTASLDDDIKIVGCHYEIEGSIMHEMFDFDKKLFLAFGVNPTLYKQLDDGHKKVLNEMLEVKYMNNGTGNNVIIYLPSRQNSITSNQLEVLKYISDCIEEAFIKLRRPIKVMATDRKKSMTEINSLKYNIIPFLENYIDDTYIQSVSDRIIVNNRDKIK